MPGSTNLLEVVVAGDGRLRFRPGLLQSLSSMFSISTGGSIGREGPIAQLSATLVSKFGPMLHWQPYRLRLWSPAARRRDCGGLQGTGGGRGVCRADCPGQFLDEPVRAVGGGGGGGGDGFAQRPGGGSLV
jgi:hypothetical protein